MGDNLLTEEKSFMVCEKCGKRVIERQPNGMFHFIFGKKKDKDGNLLMFCPVEIFIHGSIKIRCLSRTCGHWNTYNYFPFSEQQLAPAEAPSYLKGGDLHE